MSFALLTIRSLFVTQFPTEKERLEDIQKDTSVSLISSKTLVSDETKYFSILLTTKILK